MKGNLNLEEALRLWTKLGDVVKQIRGTGEWLFSHPQVGYARINCRRKDTPRKVMVLLRRLEKATAGQGMTPGRPPALDSGNPRK